MNFKLLLSSALITTTLGLGSIVPRVFALTFYDFSITWPDQTKTTGWFEVDEKNPFSQEVNKDPGYEATTTLYSSATDFFINHRGQVFTKNNLPSGYSTTFFAQLVNYPTTSYYHSLFGDQLKSFEFQVKDQNGPTYLQMFHYKSQSGYYEQNNPGSTYAAAFDSSYRYTNTVNWLPRTTASSVTSVPESTPLMGLMMVGVGFVALRRRT